MRKACSTATSTRSFGPTSSSAASRANERLMRDRFLWWGCAVYAVLFTILGAIKYAVHRNLVDFGIFQQTIASAFGCFCNPLEGSHWAFHFSPILYVLGVVVAIVPAPLTIVALQAVAGALCAPPMYAIVRARSDRTTARLTALVVWLYPPLAGSIFGDVHENGFAPAAVAWTLYAFDRGRLGWAAFLAAVTLAIKEDQALFLAFAGACGAFAYRNDPRRARLAAGIAVVAIGVALAFFLLIQPHAQANPRWEPVRFYAWTADDARTLVSTGILERLGFLLLILAPLAFVPLRSRAVILAVPPLIEVLASARTPAAPGSATRSRSVRESRSRRASAHRLRSTHRSEPAPSADSLARAAESAERTLKQRRLRRPRCRRPIARAADRFDTQMHRRRRQ